ncbi:hypothetical protein [Vulgatibacter sp.]|uniref:hypothetical protein n=1 Tax=Vulgatibacter sp. TaxID=1971226 RepID=UPI0035654E50
MNDVDFRELARLAEAGGPLAARAFEHVRREVQRLQAELERCRDQARELRNVLAGATRLADRIVLEAEAQDED